MKKIALIALVIALVACSQPTDIVFGPDPLKQMSEQGDKFKKLSEEDRMLLVGYVGLHGLATSFGGKADKPITGRTVGEVLKDARDWKTKLAAQDVENKKKEAAVTALRAKVIAERQAVIDKLSGAVTVAVTDKRVRGKDYSAGRLYEQLELVYAVENKSDKAIRQLKGRLLTFDATGDEIGALPLEFSELIKPRSTVRTDTGSVWNVRRFDRGNIERIADADFTGMKTRFEVEAIAYVDGEVLKAPDLSELE